jgi:hypothetical protein
MFRWPWAILWILYRSCSIKLCYTSYPDRNFKEILNQAMKAKNSTNNICYGYICPIATLQDNVTPINQDDLYIILTVILRRIWIWNLKFKIPSVAPAINRCVSATFWAMWPHRIRSFEVALGLIFPGESISELRNYNSISGTFHGYICVSATLRDNLTSPNQIIWSGTEAYFPRRIHIWTQNFGIPLVASSMAIFLFQSHCGTIWPPELDHLKWYEESFFKENLNLKLEISNSAFRIYS